MYVAHFMVSRAKTPWESGALMDEKLRWNGLQRSLAWNVLSRDRTMQFELEYRQKMVYIYIYNIYVIYVYNIYIYIILYKYYKDIKRRRREKGIYVSYTCYFLMGFMSITVYVYTTCTYRKHVCK